MDVHLRRICSFAYVHINAVVKRKGEITRLHLNLLETLRALYYDLVVVEFTFEPNIAMIRSLAHEKHIV